MSVLPAPRRMPLAWRVPVDPWAILALPVAAAAAWLFVTRPLLIQLLAATVLAVPLLVSPRARVLFVVVGTLTVFGPAELNAPKLLFLFGTVVALAGSFMHRRAFAGTPAHSDLKPLFHASFGLLLVVALSFPVAHYSGVPRTDWLRDVAPYVLLACAPFFAFDAQSAFDVPALRRLIAVVGIGGSAAFTIHWYIGRGITSSLTEGFGLATFLLGGALFAFAIAVALHGTRARLRWLALGSLVFAMIATTGTRSALVFLVAPFVIVLGTRRHLARRSLRLIVLVPIAALLVGLGAEGLFRVLDADEDVVSRRVELLFQSGTRTDQSYLERRLQTEAAWALFRTDPVFGVGPGHVIAGRNPDGTPWASPTIDSPVGFLVDFGVVGLAAVAFLAGAFVSVLRRLRRRGGLRTTGQLALIGFGAILATRAVLQVPFEDKGLSVAMILLLAVGVREARERWESAAATSRPAG